MLEDRLETRQMEDIPKTRAHKVADQPETRIIHLNLKAADLQGMRAITLLQEPKADLLILLHHQVAVAAAVVQPAVAVVAAVHVHQEQEEVNQFKHTR
ncbi:hypothetical protein D3C73_986470 [compost metagenome]